MAYRPCRKLEFELLTLEGHEHTTPFPLPFCYLAVIASKSVTFCVAELDTLGEHILAKRTECRLFKKDVARQIGVSEETIGHWEANKTEPEVKYWPRIMEFLGYCPYREVKTFGDLLFLHRAHQGLSHRQLAKMIGCDPGSLSRWETGERNSGRKARKLAEQFFQLNLAFDAG